MTKNNRFSPAFEKGHFNGLVDEGEYLRQSLLLEQNLLRTQSRPKTSVISVARNLLNQRNLCPRYPRLINDLRLYICRDFFTNVMSALQIHLFMQNEPNFKKVKLSVTIEMKKDYEQMDTWSIRKNEPKTNPIEPKTNPILDNKTSIRTQFKPKQTQFQSKSMPNLKINTRPNPFRCYADRRSFPVDHGLNLPCLEAPICAKALIFGKKMLLRKIPDKAGAALCRFVYIRKSLYLRNKQGIISADFRLRIENK